MSKKSVLYKILLLTAAITLIMAACGPSAKDNATDKGSQNNTELFGTTSPNASQSNDTDDKSFNAQPLYGEELLGILKDETLPEEYIQLLDAPLDFKPEPSTSYIKLHQSFEKCEITEEEYSKYLILLQHQPELLPSAFTGVEGTEPIDYAYQYIADNYQSLSEETKRIIDPYMLPISDPRSFYSLNDFDGDVLSQAAVGTHRGFFRNVNAADETKQLVLHEFFIDNQKFTIEYYEYSNWNDDKKLEFNMCVKDIEEAIKISYEKFKTLLAVTFTKPVKIEMAQLEKGTNGEAWFQDGSHRIRLTTAIYKNAIKLKATAAHELFHCFQQEMGLKFSGTDLKWLHEATAKWSEHYAFEEYNTEHGYLQYFFNTLDRDRINFGNNYEYSGYMMFYYFSDYGMYNIVPEILWGAAANGGSHIRKYLSEDVAQMRDQYGDYAFKTLNMIIAKQYYDYGDLPGRPRGKSYRSYWMKVNEEDNVTVTLKPGALQYYYYIFNRDDEIKHVDFEFTDTFDNDKYIKRQALVKIDGEWSLEDWSAVDNVSYCKLSEFKNENIDAVILVYSNSSFKEGGVQNPVDHIRVSTGRCPSEMKITIEAQYEYINGDFTWTSQATLEDTVTIKEHCFFLSKNCNYNLEGIGIMEGKKIIDTESSFSAGISEPTLENSMLRLIKPMSDHLEDLKKELAMFGVDETTPRGGILVTLPSLDDGEEMSGSATLYLPEPVGEMTLDYPLPFDGLSQVISVELSQNDWNPEGFHTEMTIDYFSHKPAILDWFKVDFGQLQSMLSSLGGMEILDISGQLKDSGINLEGLDLEGLLPDTGGNGGNDSLTKTMDAFMNLMNPPSVARPGMSAVIKLNVTGRYTDYN